MKTTAYCLAFAFAVVILANVLALQASAEGTPATATAPASQPAVLATVGDVKITSDQVDKLVNMIVTVGKRPPESIDRNRILVSLIKKEIARVYVAKQKIEVTDDEVQQEMDEVAKAASQAKMTTKEFMQATGTDQETIRDQARIKKLVQEQVSKAKIEAMVKAHPEYFDGTTVQASHILIKCEDSLLPTAKQKEIVARLEAIAADIQSGKISFEDAAKKNSDCPSKEQGGDLGRFSFDRMVAPFSIAAFGGKVGTISPVIRTQYGFHIIKVTARTDGTGKPGPDAEQLAKRTIEAKSQMDLWSIVLDVPLVINSR